MPELDVQIVPGLEGGQKAFSTIDRHHWESQECARPRVKKCLLRARCKFLPTDRARKSPILVRDRRNSEIKTLDRSSSRLSRSPRSRFCPINLLSRGHEK